MDPNEARCLLGPYQNNNSKSNILKCKHITCLIIYSSIKLPYLMTATKITLLMLTTFPLLLNLTFKCEQSRHSFLMCHHITMHQNSTLVIAPFIRIDLAKNFKFKNVDVGLKIESNFMCTSQIP